MPDTPSQPEISGEPVPHEAASFEERPSDTDAAHDSEEGGAVRDPRLDPNASADQNHGSLDGHSSGKDRREDYGKSSGVQDTTGPA